MVVAVEMQSVAVGWHVYDITHKALDLGLVGLAQFLPGILLFLVSGHSADRFDRRRLLTTCYTGYALCSALLFAITVSGFRSVTLIYAVMVLVGVVRSFSGPVSRAIMPQLVPGEHFQNAVAWNSSAMQSANIAGPAIGGLIYAWMRGPSEVYLSAAIIGAAAVFATLRITLLPGKQLREPINLRTLFAGFHYIWRKKAILGSISLDLFAVLLGGAVALLPVYARDILHTGPWGLGLLRCSPAIGSGAMALLLAYRPLRRRAGITMLLCVAAFGIFTILFGVSRSIPLSMLALVLVGASDMISVNIRAILVQMETPNEMRGRVNAVDMIFIGASNEFGQFESGLTAAWFGAVPAVILGGIGTLAVTALWAFVFPELREFDQL